MKRRTFLKLSPAFLALPLSLELSSCGASNLRSPDIAASSTSEPTPDVSSDVDSCADTDISNYSGQELTLEEAQEYSRFTNCPYFIHWSSGSFSPVPVTLESDSTFVTFLDICKFQTYHSGSALYSSRAELVYISTSGSVPDTVSFYTITEVGNTIPATIDIDSSGVPWLVSLKRYGYREDIPRESLDDIPHHAGKRNRQDEYYFWVPFPEANSSIGSGSTMLSTAERPVSLDGSLLKDIVSNYMGYDNLFHTATLTNPITDIVVKKEFVYRNYYNFSPDEEIDLIKLYQYGKESPATIEWYKGTEYHNGTLYPSCAYFVYDKENPISCPLSFNPNGYATIDLSSLPNSPHSYILNCKEETGTPHHAYLFVNP